MVGVANFDNKEDPVVSSDYEYVVPLDSGFVRISDQLWSNNTVRLDNHNNGPLSMV